jgi:hypothetical protein
MFSRPLSFFLLSATGALKMRLTWHNLRNFKDNGSGYDQPSRIKYAQNQSSRGMNARSRIFNDQAVVITT